MSVVFNGTTVATIKMNEVATTSMKIDNLGVFTSLTLKLKAAVFNASGNWTVPAGVTSVVVACTGGGGGGYGSSGGSGSAGGGSGRSYATKAVTAGQVVPVVVGAGGTKSLRGGTSSCLGVSCLGGYGGDNTNGGTASYGYNGGGKGGWMNQVGFASNCPAVLTLAAGAVDSTGGLYKAKAYSGGANISYGAGGGGGCYGVGGQGERSVANNNYAAYAQPNTGAGGGASSYYTDSNRSVMWGGSGKVVIFYYTYE